MAKGKTEKLNLQLTFMVGARHPAIFPVLGKRGFSDETLDEGWGLFQAAAGVKLPARPTQVKSDVDANSALAELDKWENEWFPVVDASLKRHHPDVHALVFDTLGKTDGRGVIVTVTALLTRLDMLKDEPRGEDVHKLLESRGLTPAVRQSVDNLLALLKSQGDVASASAQASAAEEREKAAAAAWAWYQEWSTIARTVITRGDHLARLGLRKPKRAKAGEEKVEQAKTV